MRPYLLIASLLLCPLFAAGCGGSDDPKSLNDAGAQALNSSQYKDALEHFEHALEVIGAKPDDPQYLAAKLGAIEARIHIDAKQAAAEFLALAKALPSKVSDRDFMDVSGKLASAKAYGEAIEVIEQGKKVFAESTQLAQHRDTIYKTMQKSGDAGALEKLKGIGYL